MHWTFANTWWYTYTQKRPVYTQKRPVYNQKRPIFAQKRIQPYELDIRQHFMTYIHSKKTCTHSKKTYIRSKETCIHSKETCINSKKTYIRSKETCIHSKKTYIRSKETLALWMGHSPTLCVGVFAVATRVLVQNVPLYLRVRSVLGHRDTETKRHRDTETQRLWLSHSRSLF